MDLKKTERCHYCCQLRPLYHAMPENRRVYKVIHHLPNGTRRCLRCGNPDEWRKMTDPAEIQKRADAREHQQQLVMRAVRTIKRRQRWQRIKRTLRMA